jgi:uncharacterized membrane protein YcaP (DUF421 family)
MDDLASHMKALFGDAYTILFSVLRTAVVYVAVLLVLRLGGRRQLGQLAPFDLIMLLLLSNAVQNAMIGPDNSLAGGLLAALTLIVSSRLIARSPWLRGGLEGKPTLLVHQGQAQEDDLRREGISRDELMTAIREHGITGLESVASAVLEMDGTISVIPIDRASIHKLREVRSSRNR